MKNVQMLILCAKLLISNCLLSKGKKVEERETNCQGTIA